ncbi:DUF2461 domain-containing protein [Thermodesulfobacteriota bacterium]
MTNNLYFRPETFTFLKELAQNNNRQWFQQHKMRYEEHVKEPAMRFIIDFGEPLRKISRHFTADPRPVGGSMFRIYRDIRFSKNKRPYKTNAGVQFRHSRGKDVHAPGYYLNIEPGNVFAALGIWHPDPATLGKIRDAICENPSGWKRTARGKSFRSKFNLAGDSLIRAPKGYDPHHPLIEDLKRKDFIGTINLSQKAVTTPEFPGEFAELCRAGSSFMKFLCHALELPF